MGADQTRVSFDPWDDYAKVIAEQGRPLVDADLTELVDILHRRWRAETIDIIGRCVVPRNTPAPAAPGQPPEGFRIIPQSNTFRIGRGRAYVDGLLAENHGLRRRPLASTFGQDPVLLGEVAGTSAVAYEDQPYLHTTVGDLPTSGRHLIYLDVWEREISSLEDPKLIDAAIGVETSARVQTVWQVRVHPDALGSTVRCDTPDEQIPGWAARKRPSAGRLTTAGVAVPTVTDPCVVPPNAGYNGTENRLYRVEVHAGGGLGAATIKWSRDAASIATRVSAISAVGLTQTALTVERVGRDPVLRFRPGDWVEVTDDRRDLAGQAGVMAKVDVIDEDVSKLTLATVLAGFDATDPNRHTRVRRWDQSGSAVDANGGLVTIPAAANPATSLVLESGVQLTFGLAGPAGSFKVGDYWLFTARTADGKVEELKDAPPRGVHHHYCRLALLDFPVASTTVPDDCRTFWPPEVAEGCDCSVCVTPQSHNSGMLTIQQAVDQVKARGGTICLSPGVYRLGQPVRFNKAQSVRMHGHGWQTILFVVESNVAAIVIEDSTGILIEELMTLGAAPTAAPALNNVNVVVRDSRAVTIRRCALVQADPGAAAPIGAGTPADLKLILGAERRDRGQGVLLGGLLHQIELRENVIVARRGIASKEVEPREFLFEATDLYIEDNVVLAGDMGIVLIGVHRGEARVAGNVVSGASNGAILVLGQVFARKLPGSRVEVVANIVRAGGLGIAVAADDSRIEGNDIHGLGDQKGDGIALTSGVTESGIERCVVANNRIIGVRGDGVIMRTTVRSAVIDRNVIDTVGGDGISVDEKSVAEFLTISHNRIASVGDAASRSGTYGVRVLNTNRVEVRDNLIAGVARGAGPGRGASSNRAGISARECSAAVISGNTVVDIGPDDEFVGTAAGIEVGARFDRLDIVNNRVRRSLSIRAPGPANLEGKWWALRIAGSAERLVGLHVDTARLFASVSLPLLAAPPGTLPPGVSPTPGVTTTTGATTIPRVTPTPGLTPFPEGGGPPPTDLLLDERLLAREPELRELILRPEREVHATPVAEPPRAIPRGRELISVTGNLFEAFGVVSAVEAFGDGAILFSDNRCVLETEPDGKPVVSILGGAIVANANYVVGPAESRIPAMALVTAGPFTILGNITSKAIQLNGGGIQSTVWGPLNVVSA